MPPIRCLHVDYDSPGDTDGDPHWRCHRIFEYDPVVPIEIGVYCPLHRPLYEPGAEPPTKAEREAGLRAMERLARPVTMPAAKPAPEPYYEPTPEELAWARQEIARQQAEAGLERPR